MTPQAQRILQPTHKEMASPLPPSSPPPPSSPQSSPARFNLVSSPGPMGPLPKEEEYDDLPYTLPPGPYSPHKPDLSYAALVGRAILSSPEHRLTLQEIYDWITIVYPHYKRGETTWMNSIRHVLSTTVCFRKVPRDRAIGRTLWAIWDQDLPCFKDGGFKKHLCKEYANTGEGREKVTGGSKGRPRIRKRIDDDDIIDGRKAKRVKRDQAAVFSSELSSIVAPLFPPTRPTPHHQPYYESCIPQPQVLPAEIIFPPLPATAAFNRVVNSNISSSACETTIPKTRTTPPSFPSSSSSSSVPDLTPNRNSSSPPSSLLATSDMEVDGQSLSATGDIGLPGASSTSSEDRSEVDVPSGEDSVFNTALLGPVRFWGSSPTASTVLQPGIELFNFDNISEGEDEASRYDKKGKKLVSRNTKVRLSCLMYRFHSTNNYYLQNIFPPVPTSPTPNCRVKRKRSDDAGRPSTPPIMPCTPPRNNNQHQISSIRTPLSHKGLHMSPTASLAHYKSNLDPPPPYNGGHGNKNPTEGDDEVVDPMQTPRKRASKTDTLNLYGPPVTPKKLIFPSGLDDSPFHTSGGLGSSPFRTPSSRSIIDPHDPRALLDEELNRIGNSYGDSPAGLFGKGRGSLLYDSPGLDSPGKWSKWW